jgi:amino-acid N-acetyltransferase
MKLRVQPATHRHIQKIHSLIAPYVVQGIILERTIEEITDSLDTFFVIDKEDKTIGVVAYHNYGESLFEIRSLAVKKEIHQGGMGTLLVQKLLETLLQLGAKKVFTLTYAPAFFERIGFTRVPKSTLPQKIWKDCSRCNNRDNCQETALIINL